MVISEASNYQSITKTIRHNINYRCINTDNSNYALTSINMQEIEKRNKLSIEQMDFDYILNQDVVTSEQESFKIIHNRHVK